MPTWFTPEQLRILEAALDRVIPSDEHGPGAGGCGVAGYVDQLLGAFAFDPPRIWPRGPFSGRAGGAAGFDDWVPLSALDELAWRTRIEGWQDAYTRGLAALGADFAHVDGDEQDARLRAHEALTALLYEHACEGMYGAPEYGGNRDLRGWRSIAYVGDVQPRGWTDDEVRLP